MPVITDEDMNRRVDRIREQLDELMVLVERNEDHAIANAALGVAKGDRQQLRCLDRADSWLSKCLR